VWSKGIRYVMTRCFVPVWSSQLKLPFILVNLFPGA
jgi:hypothetical protein